MIKCSVTPCAVDDESFAFISYAHADAQLVFPIMEALSARGYAMWYDHGIAISSTWTNEIGAAIIGCHIFVVFVSKSSASSVYVLDELGMAKSKGKTIVPVYLEGMGVLTAGLELGLNSTQGINESDPNLVVERLCAAFEGKGVIYKGDDESRERARKTRIKYHKARKKEKINKKRHSVGRSIAIVIISLGITACAIIATTLIFAPRVYQEDPDGVKTRRIIENIKDSILDGIDQMDGKK